MRLTPNCQQQLEKPPIPGTLFSKLSGEEVVMANEFIGLGPIVTGLTIKGASSLERGENFVTRSEALLQRLRATCEPPSEATIFLRHRGFRPVYADTDDQAGGCFWTNSGDGGGVGQLVLAPIDEREARIWAGVRFVVAPNGKTARLTLE
jgi:hypothetical protein